ncbi:MAG: thioredoxin family protein, partial [Firmicutes bacterium]|nr:thioredoxin family protein [Bacillota bacterium]
YLGTFANHFSTIGLVGMNEACLNAKWIKKDLTSPEAQQFTEDVLNHMRERLSDYQEQYGDLFNLEATPAESTSYRLAKHDKKRYPDIITANMNGTPYYTNSSHLPVGFSDDVFSALGVQDRLQTLYTSGTVFHAFLGEKLPGWQSAATLVRTIAENYKLPYYTISPTYSICKNHGYLAGEVYTCPECGAKTEVYSRITGYYRPVQNWNDGKTQEFKDRKTYDVGGSMKKRFPKGLEAFAAKSAQAAPAAAATPAEAVAEKPEKSAAKLLLFTTRTCPNCAAAKEALNEAGIGYEIKTAEENRDLARTYGIMQAPTAVIVDGDKITKYVGISSIKDYIQKTV